MSAATATKSARGFTLIELVVVVVLLSVLAAVAVPKFIGMSAAARVARVKAAYGAVSAAATGAAMQCRLTPGCFVSTGPSTVQMRSPDGGYPSFYYGAPTGGSISDYVTVDALTIVLYATYNRDFQDLDAPDPTHCLVRYVEAQPNPGFPAVTMDTTGC